MAKNQVKQTPLTLDEINNILPILKGRKIHYVQPTKSEFLCDEIYMYMDGQQNIHIKYKDYDVNTKKWKAKHLVIDSFTPNQVVEDDLEGLGRIGIKTLKTYCLLCNEDFEFKHNSDFVIYDNDDTNVVANMYYYIDKNSKRNEWLSHCYGYDMNSCYPYFMTKPLPYGEIIREDDFVKEGEIGFSWDITIKGDKSLRMNLPGEYACYILKSKIYQGFVDWANTEYLIKLKAKNTADYDLIKKKYNAVIGNMKYHNIFIRIAVLDYAYKYMESLRDDNTIMQTVDSIVSSVPRPDLNIGDNLGQFKEEHTDEPFIFKKQSIKKWLYSDTSYKGNKASRRDEEHNLIQTSPAIIFNEETFKFDEIESTWEQLWPEYKGD